MNHRVGQLYELLAGLPVCTAETPSAALPSDGIYFFFEEGERSEVAGTLVSRVVRVGTHKVDGRLPTRIRQHFGNKNSLGGHKNGSVFRKHVGGALLRKQDLADSRLEEWITQDGKSFPEVEEMVSRQLRSYFSFAWVPVPTKQERLSLESGLIALLAQHRAGSPSTGWLGHSAFDSAIATSGLWNTQHLKSAVLSDVQLAELRRLPETPRG